MTKNQIDENLIMPKDSTAVVIENPDLKIMTKKGDKLSVNDFFDIFKYVEDSKKSKKTIELEIQKLNVIRSKIKKRLRTYRTKKLEDLKRIKGKEKDLSNDFALILDELKISANEQLETFIHEKGDSIDGNYLIAENRLTDLYEVELAKNEKLIQSVLDSITAIKIKSNNELDDLREQRSIEMMTDKAENEKKTKQFSDSIKEEHSSYLATLDTILQKTVHDSEHKVHQLVSNAKNIANELKQETISKQVLRMNINTVLDEIKLNANQKIDETVDFVSKDLKQKIENAEQLILDLKQDALVQNKELLEKTDAANSIIQENAAKSISESINDSKSEMKRVLSQFEENTQVEKLDVDTRIKNSHDLVMTEIKENRKKIDIIVQYLKEQRNKK